MPMFHYEATDRTGRNVVGSMDAADETTVRRHLAERGYTPVLVETVVSSAAVRRTAAGGGGRSMGAGSAGPQGNAGAGPSPNAGASSQARASGAGRRPSVTVSTRHLAQFYQQMATMLRSGVPLPHALTQVQGSVRDRTLRRAVDEIDANVARGRPMSEAMERHPRAFSAGQVGLVKAGETAGFLDRAFAELARQAESDWGLETAARFNIVLVLFKLFAIPFLVAWMVFMSGFGQWSTPDGLDTQALAASMGRAVLAGVLSLVFMFAVWPAVLRAIRLSPLGRALDAMAYNLPLISARRRRVDRVKALSSLSSAINAGVPLGIAWELAAESTDTARFQNAMRAQLPAILRGVPVPEAMTATRLFTDNILQMAHSGEVSGNLPDMLAQATVFEREEAQRIGQLTPWITAAFAYFLFLAAAAYLVVTFGARIYGGALTVE